ncbi:MAG: hypothetical protein LJE91_00420 [Gammaproteobacteria bacterium]|jgi:mono/diheme cytochrome c family protein|nr:hypothetical protein [Gammaproteobacteria bacterium]
MTKQFPFALTPFAFLAFLAFLLQGCSDGSNEGNVEAVTLSTPNSFLRFFNQYENPPDRGLNDEKYAEAYYAAVDPTGQRRTLGDFVSLHGLGGADTMNVIYRNTRDLGYGRDMYMRKYVSGQGCKILVFYVRNFLVEPVPGFDYGPLNLEAAINNDTEFHFGTNAIEVSPANYPSDCSGPTFLKFFTYDPAGDQPLRTTAYIDGRGAKAMPQVCVSCHGGTLRPLDKDARFQTVYADDTQAGDIKGQLEIFSVDTFEFSDQVGYPRQEWEARLKTMNAEILATYQPSENPIDDPGSEWDGKFAREILTGHYGGNKGSDQLPSNTFVPGFVPEGWSKDENVKALYTSVVGPHCIVCHAGRGITLDASDANPNPDSQDVDFSTWEKFESYADESAQLVFDEGRMPLSLLNFETFWEDPSKPERLASALEPLIPDFSSRYRNADGSIRQPGRPVANAGLDRCVPVNRDIHIDGRSSLFSNQYVWEVTSAPQGANPTLVGQDTQTPIFTTDTVGDYRLKLVTSQNGGISSASALTIKVVDAAEVLNAGCTVDVVFRDPADPDCVSNDASKRSINCLLIEKRCTGCHGQRGPAGKVVWFTEEQPKVDLDSVPPVVQPVKDPDAQVATIKARVNFLDIPRSPLLTKSTGQHHSGPPLLKFDETSPLDDPSRQGYNSIVNWIYQGAQ